MNTNGKNRLPSGPIWSVAMVWMKSYSSSAAACSRPGTIARGRMPTYSSSRMSADAITIIRLDWLKRRLCPNEPRIGCSANWPSASMLCPPATTRSPF